MAKTIALHVVVLHFAHALDPQRLPREIFAGTPAALSAGHAAGGLAHGIGPLAPGVGLERAVAQRRQFSNELLPPRHRERRGDAHVLKAAAIVIEAEQQRPDPVLPALVPAEAGHHAIGRARVLDLEHRALARLVGAVSGLRDDAVEARAFEARQPVSGKLAIARHGREMDGRDDLSKRPLERGTALLLGQRPQIAITQREQIEGDERRRDFFRQLRDP